MDKGIFSRLCGEADTFDAIKAILDQERDVLENARKTLTTYEAIAEPDFQARSIIAELKEEIAVREKSVKSYMEKLLAIPQSQIMPTYPRGSAPPPTPEPAKDDFKAPTVTEPVKDDFKAPPTPEPAKDDFKAPPVTEPAKDDFKAPPVTEPAKEKIDTLEITATTQPKKQGVGALLALAVVTYMVLK